MDYAKHTVQNRNPLKRWLHQARYAASVKLLRIGAAQRVLDYGCGAGELTYRISQQYPDAQLVAYDPAAALLEEARRRLAGVANVMLCPKLDRAAGQFDRIACLETVEHLPAEQLAAALDDIRALLAPGGRCLFTFPIEHGAMSLLKNCYRMATRGDQYATPARAARAFFNFAVARQPTAVLSDCRYIYSHVGFDCRGMLRTIEQRFAVRQVRVLPAGTVAFGLGNGLAVVAERRQDEPAARPESSDSSA